MKSDEALYMEVCEGSERAFAELYARYERPLFGFILRRCSNRQDAEEIFHDVMMKVLKSNEVQLNPGGFAAWIYKIALNATLNHLRSHARSNVAKKQLVEFGEEQEDSTQILINQETRDQVLQAVETLSPALRQVHDLRLEGKSYEETANDLDIPVGSVKSRLHAMVLHLRKEISKWNAK